jgi:hypothetical protein
MKFYAFILCFLVGFAFSYNLENLYTTKTVTGTTVTVVCEYLHTSVIDSVYMIERDDREVIIRAKSGTYRFERHSVINLNWKEETSNKVVKNVK